MSTPVSDYPSALDFLLHRINYERTLSVPYGTGEFKLDRMRRLLALIGDPHLAVKAVHIAGTKGKGSTAAMIAAALSAAEYRTGLYTSPHLERIEERIVVDGLPCSAAEFAALAAGVQPAVERIESESAVGGGGATFFEVTTAMAFLHFARANVDVAVLEVGLGGWLDSTNLCQPQVCVITSISFDHVKQLGNTLAAIAGEKAGIIKPSVPVISGVMKEEPRGVIAAKAAECGAPLIQVGVDYDFSSESDVHESLSYREPAHEPRYELRDVQLNMLGNHQAANAAAAIAAINQLRQRGWSISDEAIRSGLAAARCPARIELVASRPEVILDVAHNLASIEALLAVVQERFPARRRILVFASSKDKDYGGMLKLLIPAFDVIFLTQYIHNPRAMEPEGLLRIAQQQRRTNSPSSESPTLHLTARPTDAWRLARLIAQPDDLLCVTGSFFLAAELRPVIAAATL